jgi:phosphatidylglycerophosphate synthase
MLDYTLRGIKERALTAIAIRIGQVLHPTTITFMAFMVGLIGVWLLVIKQYNLGLIFWLLNRILDGLDGTVARQNKLQSDLGGYLDIVTDFVIYALIPIALVFSDPTAPRYLSLAILLATFYVNAASWMYLAAILEKRAQGSAARGEMTTVTMPAGLIGGAETIIFYCLFLLFPAYIASLFVTMSLLVSITIGQRLVWAVRHLS